MLRIFHNAEKLTSVIRVLIAIAYSNLTEHSVQQKIPSVQHTSIPALNLLKKFTEHCRAQKRGLMQKLITGKWRINDV